MARTERGGEAAPARPIFGRIRRVGFFRLKIVGCWELTDVADIADYCLCDQRGAKHRLMSGGRALAGSMAAICPPRGGIGGVASGPGICSATMIVHGQMRIVCIE